MTCFESSCAPDLKRNTNQCWGLCSPPMLISCCFVSCLQTEIPLETGSLLSITGPWIFAEERNKPLVPYRHQMPSESGLGFTLAAFPTTLWHTLNFLQRSAISMLPWGGCSAWNKFFSRKGLPAPMDQQQKSYPQKTSLTQTECAAFWFPVFPMHLCDFIYASILSLTYRTAWSPY